MLGGVGEFGKARLWEYGLTGRGELIGVADTGIDFDNCYFEDSANVDASGYPTSSHRKVPFYRRLLSGRYAAKLGDALYGHGTHVSGTIAGEVVRGGGAASMAEFDGIAPHARIVIDDFSDDESEDIILPDSLQDGLWPYSYEKGARVHSNSWGDDSTEYTIDAREADAFMYEFDDFLVIVAAGNAGG